MELGIGDAAELTIESQPDPDFRWLNAFTRWNDSSQRPATVCLSEEPFPDQRVPEAKYSWTPSLYDRQHVACIVSQSRTVAVGTHQGLFVLQSDSGGFEGLLPHANPVVQAALGPESAMAAAVTLATGPADGSVHFWDLARAGEGPVWEHDDWLGSVVLGQLRMAITDDGNLLAVGDDAGVARLINTSDGSVHQTLGTAAAGNSTVGIHTLAEHVVVVTSTDSEAEIIVYDFDGTDVWELSVDGAVGFTAFEPTSKTLWLSQGNRLLRKEVLGSGDPPTEVPDFEADIAGLSSARGIRLAEERLPENVVWVSAVDREGVVHLLAFPNPSEAPDQVSRLVVRDDDNPPEPDEVALFEKESVAASLQPTATQVGGWVADRAAELVQWDPRSRRTLLRTHVPANDVYDGLGLIRKLQPSVRRNSSVFRVDRLELPRISCPTTSVERDQVQLVSGEFAINLGSDTHRPTDIQFRCLALPTATNGDVLEHRHGLPECCPPIEMTPSLTK